MANSGRFYTQSFVEFWQHIGQTSASFGRTWQKCGRTWPGVANFGRSWPHVGRCWAIVGQHRLSFAGFGANLGSRSNQPTIVGQFWGNCGIAAGNFRELNGEQLFGCFQLASAMLGLSRDVALTRVRVSAPSPGSGPRRLCSLNVPPGGHPMGGHPRLVEWAPIRRRFQTAGRCVWARGGGGGALAALRCGGGCRCALSAPFGGAEPIGLLFTRPAPHGQAG